MAPIEFRVTPPQAVVLRCVLWRFRRKWITYVCVILGLGALLVITALTHTLLFRNEIWGIVVGAPLGVGIILLRLWRAYVAQARKETRLLHKLTYRLSRDNVEAWSPHLYIRAGWDAVAVVEETRDFISVRNPDDVPLVTVFKRHLKGATAEEVEAYIKTCTDTARELATASGE
jgi:hypothetical protein